MKPSDTPGRGLWVLGPPILIGALLRTLLLVDLSDAPLFRAPLLDAAVYDAWARALAAGTGEGPGFFLAPLYPYLMAVCYALTGPASGVGPLLVVILQHLVGLGLVALCGWSALRRAGPVAGGAVAWLLALHGPLLLYENMLLAEVLGAGLLTGAVLLLAHGAGRDPFSRRRAAAAGVLLGLDALVRPTGLLVGAALAAWIAWRGGERRDARLVAAALLVVTMASVIMPVMVWQRLAAGEWIPITSSGGYNLYVGNHAGADGTFVQPRGVRAVPGDRGDPTGRELAEASAGRTLTDGEVSRYWLKRTRADIVADPGRSVGLYLRKLALVWNRFEVPQVVDLRAVCDEVPILRLVLPVAPVVWPLALLGILIAYPGGRFREPLVVTIVTFTLVTALVFVTARYRIQAVPVLALLAGGSVARLVDLIRRGGRARWLAPAGLVVCIVLTAPGLLGLEAAGHVWIPPLNRALRLAVTGADSSAVLAAFAEAEALGPGEARVFTNRGAYRLEIHDVDGALADFGAAAALDPEDPAAWTGLARARLGRGELEPAHAAAAEALRLAGNDPAALLVSAQILERTGRPDEARAAAEAALEIEESAGAHVVLGSLAMRRGDAQAGIGHLERAVRLAPGVASHHYNLGLACMRTGRLGAARGELEAALALEPGHLGASLALASLLAETGELEESARLLRRAIAVAPDDTRLRRLLEQVERRLADQTR